MVNKRVLFVGGASYSGTTLLDMMLASGPDVFSVGELGDLFHPSRPHHINPACGCSDPTCSIWPDIMSQGPNSAYERIFARYPHVNCIVDSTKDILWIDEQVNQLRRKRFRTDHVLIWKTPVEFAASMIKRGIVENWDKEWRNYHRLYFSVMDRWISTKYSHLAKSPAGTLQAVCQAIELAYFPGKEDYWNHTHHTLFGSPSAKIHLYSKSSTAYKHSNQELNEIFKKRDLAVPVDPNYRSIYYQDRVEEKLPAQVLGTATSDPELALIGQVLEATDAARSRDEVEIARLVNQVRLDPSALLLRRFFSVLKRIRGAVRANLSYRLKIQKEYSPGTSRKITTI